MKITKAIQQIGPCLILAAAVFAAGDGFAQQANPMDSTLAATNAYAAMVQADHARESGNWPDAVKGYRDALEQYRLLASSCPDWEPETVRFRITYCANQLDAIGRMMGISASERVTIPPPASPSDGDAYRERYLALRQENQYLRQRLIEIESDVTGAQAATNGISEVEKLKQENKQLQKQLAELTSAKNRAQTNEWSARIGKLDEERAALAMENARLKQELEKAKGYAPAPVDVRPAGAPDVLQKMHDGLAQERSGNFTAALDVYEQIIAARPVYAEALKAKGRCLLQLGKLEEAADVFRGVASANHGDVSSRVLLGMAYCLAGKYNLAVEVLTPLVGNDSPSNARAQNAIGAAWMGLGDTRTAKIALEKALSLDPKLADAHFNLAQVLLAAGPEHADEARDHYRKAITLGATSDEKLAKALGLQ
jgi:tetratricopeptide (TPR) repeat protein